MRKMVSYACGVLMYASLGDNLLQIPTKKHNNYSLFIGDICTKLWTLSMKYLTFLSKILTFSGKIIDISH